MFVLFPTVSPPFKAPFRRPVNIFVLLPPVKIPPVVGDEPPPLSPGPISDPAGGTKSWVNFDGRCVAVHPVPSGLHIYFTHLGDPTMFPPSSVSNEQHSIVKYPSASVVFDPHDVWDFNAEAI